MWICCSRWGGVGAGRGRRGPTCFCLGGGGVGCCNVGARCRQQCCCPGCVWHRAGGGLEPMASCCLVLPAGSHLAAGRREAPNPLGGQAGGRLLRRNITTHPRQQLPPRPNSAPHTPPNPEPGAARRPQAQARGPPHTHTHAQASAHSTASACIWPAPSCPWLAHTYAYVPTWPGLALQVGRGGQGVVYRGLMHGLPVAVKVRGVGWGGVE